MQLYEQHTGRRIGDLRSVIWLLAPSNDHGECMRQGHTCQACFTGLHCTSLQSRHVRMLYSAHPGAAARSTCRCCMLVCRQVGLPAYLQTRDRPLFCLQEDGGLLNATSQLIKSTLAAAPAAPLSSGHQQQHLAMAAMQPADCLLTAGSCKSTSNCSSSNSSTTSSSLKAPAARGSSSSAKAGAAHATGVPPWALLRTLLFGFDQPALEHSFLVYKYQQTRAYDRVAAAYHGLIAAAHVFNFPRSAWLHTPTQLGMLGFVCGHALVPLLVLSCRRALGPRGREAGALLVDVAAALQVSPEEGSTLHLKLGYGSTAETCLWGFAKLCSISCACENMLASFHSWHTAVISVHHRLMHATVCPVTGGGRQSWLAVYAHHEHIPCRAGVWLDG